MAGPHNKRRVIDDLVVDIWRDLDVESVGRRELEAIRMAVKKQFGDSPSPVSLARTLADHGAPLRHAEILKFDSELREKRLNELFAEDELDFSTIGAAVRSVLLINELHQHFELEADVNGLEQLRAFVLNLKENLSFILQAKIKLDVDVKVAAEVVQWLTIWLQTPQLFQDWLELRMKSVEFKRNFTAPGVSTT